MSRPSLSAASLPIIDEPGRLLCLGQAAALRERWAKGPGWLQARRAHFLTVARDAERYPAWQVQAIHAEPEGLVRPMCRPDEVAYACLGYAVTGERAMAEQGRRQLLALADGMAERETGDWVQVHTWCDAFSASRWLIYYDWIYDSGVFSEADHEHLRERLMYYLWAHVGMRLQARPLEGTPCNNQNASMAFACVVGGALFGLKRGRDPVAGRLLRQALPHLVRFATAFPRGGYSFEGSTYMGQVNAFILPIACELLADLGLGELVDARRDEGCASPRETLAAIMRLLMPGGLMLPWDAYGYAPAGFAAAAAYHARLTGDEAVLRYLVEEGIVDRPTHVGWGFDQNLWVLLWAPETAGASPALDFCHAEPTLGAAAAGPARRLFVFQMWDKSHWPPGRAQFNPNSLVLDFDGSPLLIDGRSLEIAKAQEFDAERFAYVRPDTGGKASFGIGTAGAHNCLFFDDRDEAVPRRETHGELTVAGFGEGIALFEADVTDCYRDLADAIQVRRASLAVGDAYVLVRDRIVTATDHRVCWRLHLRNGELETNGQQVRLTADDGTRLAVSAAEGNPFVHRAFADAPRDHHATAGIAPACHEITRYAHGRDLTLYTALAPSSGHAVWQALEGPWEWAWAGSVREAAGLAAAWPGGQPVDPALGAWFYQTGESRPGIGVYRRAVRVTEVPAGPVWLRLPRLSRSTMVWVNGHEFPVELGWEEPHILPTLVRVETALKPGDNVICLAVASSLEWAIQGRIELRIAAPAPSPVVLRQPGATRFEIELAGGTDRIEWDGPTARVERADGSVLELTALPPGPASAGNGIDPDGLAAAMVAKAPLAADTPRPEAVLLKELDSGDWRRQVAALAEAAMAPTTALASAALGMLEAELANHPCVYPRDPADIVWYRLKAEAARVLGAARLPAAAGPLGRLLLSQDFYPARVAAAAALQAIGTPEAVDYLRRLPACDEYNVGTVTRLALEALKG